eukprot:CAMPEP_0170407410 /NCGR_PEP_ID=MMETSP0117_2-20130122/28232_1 /TAXON_ID=400756 /ORGANISM="Durinskia baltica, Strain CSIRO CS-38" /LENGTH=88 /DNA_ID=CAMNT_0010664655 /DNA_START=388 /DNA_END=651 /DNA_ORIENTATION=+
MRLPVAGAATYMVALVLLVLELPSVSAEGSCLEPLDAMLVDADERLEQHFGSPLRPSNQPLPLCAPAGRPNEGSKSQPTLSLLGRASR